jgi:hypothetical protein
MRNQQYEVFKGTSEVFVHHVKRRIAQEWVTRGLAEVIGERQIRMVTPDREIVRTSDAMLSSGQDKAYELAGIEPNITLLQGGRVNGYRRQLGSKPYKGACVGHQP